jgi:hypothetical protein
VALIPRAGMPRSWKTSRRGYGSLTGKVGLVLVYGIIVHAKTINAV